MAKQWIECRVIRDQLDDLSIQFDSVDTKGRRCGVRALLWQVTRWRVGEEHPPKAYGFLCREGDFGVRWEYSVHGTRDRITYGSSYAGNGKSFSTLEECELAFVAAIERARANAAKRFPAK